MANLARLFLQKRWKNQELYQVFAILGCFSLFSTILLMVSVHYYLPANRPSRRNLSDKRLQDLMAESTLSEALVHPLQELVLEKEGMLNFFHLPKRMLGKQYTEITSANRDTSYPLAPDFSFHVRYAKDHVVLYEDYGPGCVYRLYLFPDLPTEVNIIHSLTSADLRDMTLNFDIDGEVTLYSLQQLQEGRVAPFLRPLSAPHQMPASGMGAYTPFCYKTHIKVSYYPDKEFPVDVFRQTVNCSRNDLLCPVKVYSAVSRHKFIHGTKVPSPPVDHAIVANAAALLERPEIYGPDTNGCSLTCTKVTKGQSKVIYENTGAGVISGLKFRVMKKIFGHAQLSPDWSNVLLSVNFDSAPKAQIDRLPLGALFAAQGSAENDMMGAALGRRVRFCSYNDLDLDTAHNFPSHAMTGYIHFTMPYWENVQITIEGNAQTADNVMLCFQVTTVKNFYTKDSTGYFHAHKTYYGEDVSGWRNMLNLDSTWGHIVGLLMEVDDLRARRNVALNERWAILQADMVLYLDGQQSASVMGTGLEDYFSYAHGFGFAENTSYSFVGVPYSAPKRKEPLSWHCYRLHILDPIPFHNSVHFVMEGTDDATFQQPVRPLPYKEYQLLRSNARTTLSHTVLYYAQPKAGMSLQDTLEIGNEISEKRHNFEMEPLNKQSRPQTVKSHFIAAVNKNETFEKTFRNLGDTDLIKFRLTASLDSLMKARYLILRREFYMPVKFWNEQCQIWINREFYGTWFMPFGSLVENYALRHEDIMINTSSLMSEPIETKTVYLDVEIRPESHWNDVAYYLFTVLT